MPRYEALHAQGQQLRGQAEGIRRQQAGRPFALSGEGNGPADAELVIVAAIREQLTVIGPELAEVRTWCEQRAKEHADFEARKSGHGASYHYSFRWQLTYTAGKVAGGLTAAELHEPEPDLWPRPQTYGAGPSKRVTPAQVFGSGEAK